MAHELNYGTVREHLEQLENGGFKVNGATLCICRGKDLIAHGVILNWRRSIAGKLLRRYADATVIDSHFYVANETIYLTIK